LRLSFGNRRVIFIALQGNVKTDKISHSNRFQLHFAVFGKFSENKKNKANGFPEET